MFCFQAVDLVHQLVVSAVSLVLAKVENFIT